MKTYPKDELGREHVEVGGLAFTVVKIEPFKDYINNKFGDWDSFLGLKRRDKEVIFLKWKYGLESPEANITLDVTDKYLYRHYKDMLEAGIKDEGLIFHANKKIGYEDYCMKVKIEIGLLQKSTIITKEVKKVTDVFGGKMMKY